MIFVVFVGVCQQPHYDYMFGNKFYSMITDRDFLLRISAVFEFFGEEKVEAIKTKIKHDSGKLSFFECIEQYRHSHEESEVNLRYAKTIAHYLKACDTYMKGKLEKFRENVDNGYISAIFERESSNNKERLNELAKAFYCGWFLYLRSELQVLNS